MSAVPKRVDSDFWQEARTAELIFPKQFGPVVREHEETERIADHAKAATIIVSILRRLEMAMSLVMITVFLILVSSVSLQALTAQIDARDTRIDIQNTTNDIGLLREELQEARASLETFDATEGMMTIPVEPGDVPIIELPPSLR
jgi:hypothetical protein